MFTTALMNHNGTPACQALLRCVESGEIVGILDPVVLGELSYMLTSRLLAPQGQEPRTARQVAPYLLGLLGWAGIEMGDKQLACAALEAWRDGQADSFVDCYLQARAAAAGEPVCADNARHFPESVHPAELVGLARPGKPPPARGQ